ncbi:MAG: acyl-CoA dehydrogenase family protein, partial [Caulobacteraceae bacterium]|nr:acyl-CoA dehydrogenase family protein [Caulobacteraceae bacterium]
MNFDISDDQRALEDGLGRLLADTCPPTVVREVLEGVRPYADQVWGQLGELGYIGAGMPEDIGGSGLGVVETLLTAKELGRVIAPVPFASHALAADLLVRCGSPAQVRSWGPRIATGESIACVALQAPGLRWADGRLDGVVRVPAGDIAAVGLFVTGGGHGVLVDLGAPGVRRRRLETLDPTMSYAEIVFDAAAADILPGLHPGEGERARDLGAVLAAFEQIGGAERCLEMARAYALERHTFGRAIGSYQVVKHKLVDMYLKTNRARSHAYYAAWAHLTDAPERT